ncbi:MAG: hypothetical protein PVG24_13850 [Gammaproteobacteria bacterium]|jgi:hypothetical protein
MDKQTPKRDSTFCEVSLNRIDAALSSTAGAMLSLEQFDEVTRLRRRIRELCENGREEEARLAAGAAMTILQPHIKAPR